MKNINSRQLLDLLLSVKSACPVSLITKTQPKMLKKNNPYFNKIWKISKINAMLNANYELGVCNKKLKENPYTWPNFRSMARKWGIHANKSLIRHGNNLYVQVQILKILWSNYYFNNKLIDISILEPFLIKSNLNRQQLDNPIIIRDYALSSIKQINLNGEYKIKWGHIFEPKLLKQFVTLKPQFDLSKFVQNKLNI